MESPLFEFEVVRDPSFTGRLTAGQFFRSWLRAALVALALLATYQVLNLDTPTPGLYTFSVAFLGLLALLYAIKLLRSLGMQKKIRRQLGTDAILYLIYPDKLTARTQHTYIEYHWSSFAQLRCKKKVIQLHFTPQAFLAFQPNDLPADAIPFLRKTFADAGIPIKG